MALYSYILNNKTSKHGKRNTVEAMYGMKNNLHKFVEMLDVAVIVFVCAYVFIYFSICMQRSFTCWAIFSFSNLLDFFFLFF